jgi:hypothetical protein
LFQQFQSFNRFARFKPFKALEDGKHGEQVSRVVGLALTHFGFFVCLTERGSVVSVWTNYSGFPT